MSDAKTGFYFDERCMWHTAAAHALLMPVGGWVEPLAVGGHAESPESKRRFKSLLDVPGLTAQLDVRSADPAIMDDLLRVHGRAYLEEFKKLSDAGGGELGTRAPFGPGTVMTLRRRRRGWPCGQWTMCSAGSLKTPIRSPDHPAIIAFRTKR